MSLLTRTTEFLRRHDVLAPKRRFVIAVSGGLDSTVLADVMGGIARRWSLELVCAYIHHGLRDDADAEERFVREMAGLLGARFATRRIDVRGVHDVEGGSLQDVARRLRYAVLNDIADEHEADAIMLAHHADDQAETVLAHFLRGSGVRGLAGMSPVRDRLYRPFLTETRAVLETWAEVRGLRWCHDSSNDSDAYSRNALRHHVIPALRAHAGAAWPGVAVDNARLFRSLDGFLEAHIAARAAECIVADAEGLQVAVQPLKGYFEYEQLALLRKAIGMLRGSEGQFDEVFSLLHLIDAEPGKHAVLRGGFRAFREKDAIVFRRPSAVPEATVLEPGMQREFGSARVSLQRCSRHDVSFSRDPNEEYIDLSRCGDRLTLRAWTADDRFTPIGGIGSLRVSGFLTSAGIPAHRRSDIPVLEGKNGLVWVCGVRLDAHAALRDDSGDIALLRFTQQQTSA
ncbi:tRNA lysidine(34) synthetase TilS [bacterium]|nr:tRNA lysidine(34) synthetase TilS [bacterium]